MSTPASAAAVVDSATTPAVVAPAAAPANPAFDSSDQHTWSSDQREEWNRTGAIPTSAEKQDSAPAAKKKAAPDSAPESSDEDSADNASDSATDKTQKPHLKTKDDTAKRFNELLELNKSLQRQLDEATKGTAKRDDKQASQPAAETPKVPGLKQFLTEFYAKAENKGKSYEDGVEAWQGARDTERAKQLEQQIRAQIAQEAAQKDLKAQVADAEKRYPDYQQRIQPAITAIVEDAQIPNPVKAILNDSPVFTDLIYVLAEPEALKDFIATARTNPAAAVRKLVLTEQLVQAELVKASGKGGKASDQDAGGNADSDASDGTKRDASGKFVKSSDSASAEPKPRAPKPPSEVGGRGTAPDDPRRSAAASGDYAAFEREETRRMAARFAKS